MLNRRPIGWELTTDDCVQHALAVGLALQAAGRKVTPDAILEALTTAEPKGWIGKMLATRRNEWSEELTDFTNRANALAERLVSGSSLQPILGRQKSLTLASGEEKTFGQTGQLRTLKGCFAEHAAWI